MHIWQYLFIQVLLLNRLLRTIGGVQIRIALSISLKYIQEALDFSNLIVTFNVLRLGPKTIPHLKLYLIELLNLLSTSDLLAGSSIALAPTLQSMKRLNALWAAPPKLLIFLLNRYLKALKYGSWRIRAIYLISYSTREVIRQAQLIQIRYLFKKAFRRRRQQSSIFLLSAMQS